MNSRFHPLRLLAVSVLLCCTWAAAQPPVKRSSSEVTLNLKDADINTLIATVSEVTGRNFIVDPRVKGKVTVISSSPMDAAGVYETFLAVLQTQGYAAIPSGESVKIVPEANARAEGGGYTSAGGLALDEIVTHVYDIRNASATQLVAILRPLVAQTGHLAAYAPSNSLIISDRAANVVRMEKIIRSIDQAGDRDVEFVPLESAAAADVVRLLTALAQQSKQADPNAQQTAVIADERANAVLLAGDKNERQKLVSVIKQLDHPYKNSGDTQVIYLRYASAENLAPILEGYAQQQAKSSSSSRSGSSAAGAAPAPAPQPAPVSGSTGGGGGLENTRVLADKDTNALVITAPPKTMQMLRNVIAQLDIRRAQVLVEGIIAEVSANKTSDLGLDYIAYKPNTIATAGILNQSTAGALSNLGSVATAGSTSGISGASGSTTSTLVSAAAALIGQGLTGVAGTVGSDGSIFGVLLKALQSDGDTNILSTPSLVTLDNEEAKIEVGQEVPFLTGSYANSGVTSTSGVVNPFQTIDRKDVGLKLGITPTIGGGDGNTLRLKIDLENSSLSSGTAGASNLITNKRTVTNTVTAESGQILVIGGLIDDHFLDQQNRIPFLSDIPFFGALFKSRSVQRTKTNLMVFIHPVVLRKPEESDFYSRQKYDEVRSAQVRSATGSAPPLGGGQRPVLYRYDDYTRVNNMPTAPSAPPPNAAPGSAPEPPPPQAPAAEPAPESQP